MASSGGDTVLELSSDLQRPGKIVEIGESSRFKRLVTERDKVHRELHNCQNKCRGAAAPAYSPINSGSPVRICAQVHRQTTSQASGRALETDMHLQHSAFAMKNQTHNAPWFLAPELALHPDTTATTAGCHTQTQTKQATSRSARL